MDVLGKPQFDTMQLEEISAKFRRFVPECEGSCGIYAHLSGAIASDDLILEVASAAQKGQPIPNLLFASVHFLLAENLCDPLAKFYPSMLGSEVLSDETFPAFREFVVRHRTDIEELLRTRLVQTNEVQRCALLLPAILHVVAPYGNRPVHLIEIGASAGLNLLWDQYGYEYSDGRIAGSPQSHLTLKCEFRGSRVPSLGSLPVISHRVGLDLNPINVSVESESLWLEALTWPSQLHRLERLRTAIRVRNQHDIRMQGGDATVLLAKELDQVVSGDLAVIFHTWVANQLSGEQREALFATVEGHGRTHDIVHLYNNIEPHFHATSYRDGKRYDEALANSDGHVSWIEWLAKA